MEGRRWWTGGTGAGGRIAVAGVIAAAGVTCGSGGESGISVKTNAAP